MIYLSNFYGLKEVSQYWENVLLINNWQKKRISKLVVEKLFGTINNKKIAILGFSFKANTNDTRDSAAIDITKELLSEGAQIVINDPKVNQEQICVDLNKKPYKKNTNNSPEKGYWWFSNDFEEVFTNADAILVLTEWEEYKKLDWDKLSKLMRKPAWIFDSRSIVDPNKIKTLGVKFWKIGDGTLNESI